MLSALQLMLCCGAGEITSRRMNLVFTFRALHIDISVRALWLGHQFLLRCGWTTFTKICRENPEYLFKILENYLFLRPKTITVLKKSFEISLKISQIV